jgi:hypothetical protein
MLTDMMVRQAKAADKPYLIADFDGLYLHVSAIGSKAWHFRYTWVGRRAQLSLVVSDEETQGYSRASFRRAS